MEKEEETEDNSNEEETPAPTFALVLVESAMNRKKTIKKKSKLVVQIACDFLS